MALGFRTLKSSLRAGNGDQPYGEVAISAWLYLAEARPDIHAFAASSLKSSQPGRQRIDGCTRGVVGNAGMVSNLHQS